MLKAYSLWVDGVTQSLLLKFLECRQKCKLYLQGWKLARQSNAIEHGTLTHAVLEIVHNWQRKVGNKLPSKESLDDIIRVVLQRHRAKIGARWSADQVKEFNVLGAQLYAVVPNYFRYWHSKPLAWTGVEHKFRIKYTFGPGLKDWTFLRGAFDGVYDMKPGLGLFDAKNKAQFSDDQLGEVLLRDWQINFYLLALWKQTGEFPREFIYNVMRRPGLDFRKNDSLPQYRDRIVEHIQEKGSDYYFRRYHVAVEKYDLLQFEAELKGVLLEFKQWLEAGMPSRLFGQPCVGKYGLCEFVRADYNGDWTPYKKREFMLDRKSVV